MIAYFNEITYVNNTRKQQPKVCPCVNPVLILLVDRESKNLEHGPYTNTKTTIDNGPVIPQNSWDRKCMNS